MKIKNVEIKARCTDSDHCRKQLRAMEAQFKGVAQQTDTYFRVETGRLKLREGNLEQGLIFYQRPNQADPKPSNIILCHVQDNEQLKVLLSAALGVKVVVVKQREIYFLDNTKIHLDVVPQLGEFVEIEVIGTDADSETRLRARCQALMQQLGITAADLISESYSDMLLKIEDR